jgi:hypothetical protein
MGHPFPFDGGAVFSESDATPHRAGIRFTGKPLIGIVIQDGSPRDRPAEQPRKRVFPKEGPVGDNVEVMGTFSGSNY